LVVVHAHDRIHEYGGQALPVDVGSGAMIAGRLGRILVWVPEADCPWSPQSVS
jgi:hypothetical protein